MLSVLVLADGMAEFISYAPPGWRIHRLSGDRQNRWSISVSGNWRLTFVEWEGYIDNMNLEDYH